MTMAMLIALILITGCSQRGSNDVVQADTNSSNVRQNMKARTKRHPAFQRRKVIDQNVVFSSFTEATQRGEGVVSVRLDIWDMDDAHFGEIVLNGDQIFFTLNMPRKVIGRKAVSEFDLAAFDPDAEDSDNNSNIC